MAQNNITVAAGKGETTYGRMVGKDESALHIYFQDCFNKSHFYLHMYILFEQNFPAIQSTFLLEFWIWHGTVTYL